MAFTATRFWRSRVTLFRMFEDARLKLKRADKHLTDLQARIAALPDFDVATVEINPEGGNEVIKHDVQDRTALSDLALIAGDAVHNLKCALDYTWLETITRIVLLRLASLPNSLFTPPEIVLKLRFERRK
jgi:hypothetical protein